MTRGSTGPARRGGSPTRTWVLMAGFGAALGLAGASPAGAVATAHGGTPPLARQSPGAILRAAERAEGQIGSVRILGRIKGAKTATTFSLEVDGNGDGGGTVVQNRQPLRFVRKGADLYLDAPAAFWTAQGSGALGREYGGKWLQLPAADATVKVFVQFADADTLTRTLFSATARVRRGSVVTLFGHRVIALYGTSHQDGALGEGALYVATQGPPRVIEIQVRTAGQRAVFQFEDYGPAVTVSAPAHPLVVTKPAR